MGPNQCFVQFLHPGLEHGPDERGGDFKSWNTGAHRRKFMRTPGSYVDRRDRIHEGDLHFWGEWEAQSRVSEIAPRPSRGLPRFLHEPFLDEDGLPRVDAQNTDPFVFGDRFRYTCCQQYRAGRPTQLARLLPGSVILFGSHLRGHFVLDTVFVVDSLSHHGARGPHLGRRAVPEAYRLATAERIYGGADHDRTWSLYAGATQAEPVDGMFSFFPCRPEDRNPSGFARPVIRLPQVVTQTHKQSYKLTRASDSQKAFPDLWADVVRQVRKAGCELGVRAELPPLRRARAGSDARRVAAGRDRC